MADMADMADMCNRHTERACHKASAQLLHAASRPKKHLADTVALADMAEKQKADVFHRPTNAWNRLATPTP